MFNWAVVFLLILIFICFILKLMGNYRRYVKDKRIREEKLQLIIELYFFCNNLIEILEEGQNEFKMN